MSKPHEKLVQELGYVPQFWVKLWVDWKEARPVKHPGRSFVNALANYFVGRMRMLPPMNSVALLPN